MMQTRESSERSLAAVCHILSIPFPFLAPAVFYFWKRGESRFVALHAAQAFFEALVLNIVLFVGMAISLAFTAAKLYEIFVVQGRGFTWDDLWMALIKAGATWVILAVISAYYTVASVVQAIQAYRGQEPKSLISSRLARRAVGPGQDSLPIG